MMAGCCYTAAHPDITPDKIWKHFVEVTLPAVQQWQAEHQKPPSLLGQVLLQYAEYHQEHLTATEVSANIYTVIEACLTN